MPDRPPPNWECLAGIAGRGASDYRDATGYLCIQLARHLGLEPGTRDDGAKNDFRGNHSTRHDLSPAENQLGFLETVARQRQQTLHNRRQSKAEN